MPMTKVTTTAGSHARCLPNQRSGVCSQAFHARAARRSASSHNEAMMHELVSQSTGSHHCVSDSSRLSWIATEIISSQNSAQREKMAPVGLKRVPGAESGESGTVTAAL